jgi:DNA-binding FadR family transcriptional regulator
MSTSPEPIQRRRLHEILAERLLARIRDGDPPPGGALPSEQELMAQFGVGRPTVREALLRLEAAGVITISHGERARVVEPSASRILGQLNESIIHLLGVDATSLEHLKDARLAIEEGLVRRATERATDASLARIAESLRRQADAARIGKGFLAEDMAFHVAIAEGAGNPLFPVFLKAMLDWLSAFHTAAVSTPGMEPVAMAEHRRIFERIEARDVEGAAAAMRSHLLRSARLFGRRSDRPGGERASSSVLA